MDSDRLTEKLLDLAGISGQDEECGSCPDYGFWAGLFRRSSGRGGHILTEDDQGFKSSESYDTTAELDARWAELQQQVDEADESEDD